MKRTLLPALAVLAVGCSESTPRNLDGFIQQGEVRETYYENGQLRDKGTVKDGELDGLFESYHENGQLRESSHFENGELNGPFEYYYENGQLWVKGNFKDNKYDGLSESYDRSGPVQFRGIYNMGEQCGEWFELGETVAHPPCPLDLLAREES